ncbi:Ubiquinone biosynthesis O-methyltransferase [Phycisphaerae bacterium RAS1]|nr:Ubiquinone biosynthesis O-methyltransferase [Phycisphaerae bacterium RAS1]
MPGDRVTELYRGQIFQTRTQRVCQDRIHWMCSRVRGERVLDIGCSQGIASMILGREGHHVVGVDVDAEALRFAEEDRRRGPEDIRERVEFRLVGSGRLPFDDGAFDTVLLGEILEHLTRPELVLAEARRVLRPDGRVVITVPFGVHPDPDHKRTFFLRSFIDCVAALFTPAELRILDKYICCVADLSAAPSAAVASDARLLTLSERAFERAEHRYLKRIAGERRRFTEVQQSLREAKDLGRRQSEQLQATSEELRKAHSRIAQLVQQVQGVEAQLSAARREVDTWRLAAVDVAGKLMRAPRAESATDETAHRRLARLAAGASGNGGVISAAELSAGVDEWVRSTLTAAARQEERRRDEVARLKRQHELESSRSGQELARTREQLDAHASESRRVAAVQDARLCRLASSEHKMTETIRWLRDRNRRQLEHIDYLKSELELKQREVRYRLGDAMVQAATSPKDFVLLPIRMAQLLATGLKRRAERRHTENGHGVTVAGSAVVDAETQTLPRTNGAGKRTPAPALPGPKALSQPSAAALAKPAAPALPSAAAKTAGAEPRAAVAGSMTSAAPTNGTSVQPAPDTAAPAVAPLKFSPVIAPDRAPRFPVKAAIIMDEFTIECFKGECQLIPVTPADWRERLTAERPDFLFVESAWRGNGGAWQSQITRAQFLSESPLVALAQWCRAQGIPTVFWNKEDPPNFEHFIYAAGLFDHVFTTDENCIERYRERLGHDRVYALPFAAQPLIHNPIGVHREKYANFCFAGTYYAKRHEDRRGDVDILLKPALSRGLHIFDRMHNYGHSQNYRFPDEYTAAIRGSLNYPEMCDAYKRYGAFLNVNSVKDSPTMFSRRVLELLACGTPVISSYSLGIEKMLGPDAVPLVRDVSDAERWMDELVTNPETGERLALRGRRRIFNEHLYQHRMEFILEKLGIPFQRPRQRVSVITCTNRPTFLDNVVANYTRQSWADKELILVLNHDAFDVDDVRRRLEGVPGARVYQLPEACTLGQCLNHAVDQVEGEYWSKFDDDNFHGEHFVTDLMHAFTYSEADLVGKGTYYAYLEGSRCLALRFANQEHRYVKFLAGSGLIVRRRVSEQVRFPEKNVSEDTAFLADCHNLGFRMYSTDRFNYVVRRGKSTDEHTWKISDDEYLRKCRVVEYTDDYRPRVVV